MFLIFLHFHYLLYSNNYERFKLKFSLIFVFCHAIFYFLFHIVWEDEFGFISNINIFKIRFGIFLFINIFF